DLEVVAQVGTAIDLRTATAASRCLAEDVTEDVTKGICKAAGASAHTVVGINAGMAVAVVGIALLRIREHLVSLLGFLEFFFRFLAARIAIRVMFHREFAIRLLELVFRGTLADTKNLVKITLRHLYL